ncbi:MAG TPA: hypothetical protein VIX42_10650 [Edaphobacter sp.]
MDLDDAYSGIADTVPGGDAVDGKDVSGDVGPFVSEMDGDDGLEVEVEEGLILKAPPLLKLNWKGTETMSPTGFWVCLARSLAFGFGWGGRCWRLTNEEWSSGQEENTARAERIALLLLL